jgi:hypothetical protein
MADQTLFMFREYVQLCQADRNVPNINLPMIQYNTKIYKGVGNTIDFVVRNNDRKPVNLVGYQIEALIQRVENAEVLLEKPVQATDDAAGRCRLTLTLNEIADWDGGYYRYAIRLTDVTGRTEYLYTDINRSSFGNFELIEGMASSLTPATKVEFFTPYPYDRNAYIYNPYPYPFADYENVWSTGALQGDAQSNQANGIHTLVAYTDNFLGDFWIQGSLALNAPDPHHIDWFNIQLTPGVAHFTYTEEYSPPIKVFNFTGNYYWVRAFYKVHPLNKGRFDKILYKN